MEPLLHTDSPNRQNNYTRGEQREQVVGIQRQKPTNSCSESRSEKEITDRETERHKNTKQPTLANGDIHPEESERQDRT